MICLFLGVRELLNVIHGNSRNNYLSNTVMLHSFLYSITGLSSVEAYNMKANEWFRVAPMNTRRSSVGVGVVGGKVSSTFYMHAQYIPRRHFFQSKPAAL